MGVTLNIIKFIRFAKDSGVDFERTLMLGRQQMMFPNSGYAEGLFKSLGAKLAINVIARRVAETRPFQNQQCCDWSAKPNSKARALGYALYRRVPLLALMLEKVYWTMQSGGNLRSNPNYINVDI
jgi:hypothetical protein